MLKLDFCKENVFDKERISCSITENDIIGRVSENRSYQTFNGNRAQHVKVYFAHRVLDVGKN